MLEIKRKPIVVALALMVAAILAVALLRRSPDLDVPGFTGRRLVAEISDEPADGAWRGGWQAFTLYECRGKPFAPAVGELDALLTARGFARDRRVSIPLWRRGDESVILSPGPPKERSTFGVGYTRPATVGDSPRHFLPGGVTE